MIIHCDPDLELHQLDTRQVDGLCPGCWLPGVLEVDFAIVASATLIVVRRITAVGCVDCGVTLHLA